MEIWWRLSWGIIGERGVWRDWGREGFLRRLREVRNGRELERELLENEEWNGEIGAEQKRGEQMCGQAKMSSYHK
jgi:hypothetical protein